jgi:hypothetical protein
MENLMDRRNFLQIAAAALVVAATALAAPIGAGATTAGQVPPPDASRLQAEALREARELRASLTDSQRLALVAVLERHESRLATAGARLASVSRDVATEAPAKIQIQSPSLEDLHELRRVTADVEDAVSAILTPAQRVTAPPLPALNAVSATVSSCYLACYFASLGHYYAHLNYVTYGTPYSESAYAAAKVAHIFCGGGYYSLTYATAKVAAVQAAIDYQLTGHVFAQFAHAYEGWTRDHAYACYKLGG